jgi:hypothetical protein
MMTLDELEAELGWTVDERVAEFFAGEHGPVEELDLEKVLDRELVHYVRDALWRVDRSEWPALEATYAEAFRDAWSARS